MLIVPPECVEVVRKFRPHGDYAKDVEADFLMIEPHLPERVDSILDIGCGLAGLDVFLKRKYPLAHLSLLDSDGEDPVYGWGETNNPYGSRKLADAMLDANGFKADRWLNAGTTEKLKADLVVSTIAWGFHFPLSSYEVEGYCIADLRKHYEKERGTVIFDNGKSVRCAFQC